MQEVTFQDFVKFVISRGWSLGALVQEFRGKIEEPREFFTRVLSGKHSGVVIPFRSVLELYFKELSYYRDQKVSLRVCACGCRLPVWDRKKWAFPACRQRAYRRRSETTQNSGSQSLNNQEPKCDKTKGSVGTAILDEKV